MTTVLQLIQTVHDEMGLSRPNAVVSSTDEQVIQILGLANALGNQLVTDSDWQSLITEYLLTTQYSVLSGTTTSGSAVVTGISSTSGLDTTYGVTGTGIQTDTVISSVDSSTQITLNQKATASGTVTLNFCQLRYSWPSDFNRLIPMTEWDKTRRWELVGPKNASEWQWLKSGIVSASPQIRYRIFGNKLQIWPPQASNNVLRFEYVSNNWASSAAGSGKSSFTADEDTCVFRDRVMISGIKAKFYLAKGMEATAYLTEFQNEVNKAIGQEQGAPILSLSPKSSYRLLTLSNVPDSGFGT